MKNDERSHRRLPSQVPTYSSSKSRFRGGGVGGGGGPALRKRSYSFSEGHCKSVSVPSSKRWKSNYHLNKKDQESSKSGAQGAGGQGQAGSFHPPAAKGGKKSKFLLGGNIRDPLNLNSLSDERVSKIVNAVTPESSPVPTPKHRKAGVQDRSAYSSQHFRPVEPDERGQRR